MESEAKLLFLYFHRADFQLISIIFPEDVVYVKDAAPVYGAEVYAFIKEAGVIFQLGRDDLSHVFKADFLPHVAHGVHHDVYGTVQCPF